MQNRTLARDTDYRDLFISHASEDKESFVRPLASALVAEDVRVWFDEFELQIGDSLRQKIDEGLRLQSLWVSNLLTSILRKALDAVRNGRLDNQANGRGTCDPPYLASSDQRRDCPTKPFTD